MGMRCKWKVESRKVKGKKFLWPGNVVALLLFLGVLSACSSVEPSREDKTIETIQDVKVGFAQMENNGPWRVAETNSIISEAELRGVDLVYTDAKGSVDKQISDVGWLLEQGIDYLLLAPKTYEPLAEALDMAKEAGVPVILIDRSAKGVPGIDYLTILISDNVWEAKMAGWLMAEATEENARIIELTGTLGASSTEERSRGFKSVIDRYIHMEIVASESADFARAEAKKVMENLIREYKDDFDAVYAQNDEMAIGAIMALKAAGIEPGKDVTVISIDGEKDALKAIMTGDLYATIECTPFFGPIAFDIIEKHIAGEEIEFLYINEDRVFTKENAADHIDEAF